MSPSMKPSLMQSMIAALLCATCLGLAQAAVASETATDTPAASELLPGADADAAADTSASTTYAKDGLSFNKPSGWKVSEDVSNDGVRYLFVEAPGYALVGVNVFPTKQSKTFKAYVQYMIAQAVEGAASAGAKRSKGSLKEVRTTINGRTFQGYRNDFTVTFGSAVVPHTQTIYTFKSAQNTAFASFQAAKEELPAAKEGFDLVLSTFKID